MLLGLLCLGKGFTGMPMPRLERRSRRGDRGRNKENEGGSIASFKVLRADFVNSMNIGYHSSSIRKMPSSERFSKETDVYTIRRASV